MENNDKKPAKRRRVTKAKFKPAPTIACNLRIPADVWEKLQWIATDRGLARPDVIRIALADAVRNAKPPKTSDSLVIDASAECRAAFVAAFALLKPAKTPEQAAFDYLMHTCEKILGAKPVFRDGVWHWANPLEENA